MREHISTNISSEVFCFKKASISLYVTLYQDQSVAPRAALLYFHGGGLLCGNRHDLPDYHIETLCNAGYPILAFDYRLAPATKIPEIMDDVKDAIRWYIAERGGVLKDALSGFAASRENSATSNIDISVLPYYLWGRSAGAYLTLLAARETYDEAPRGILSYYGYAFLEDHWYNTPCEYYLQVAPRIDAQKFTRLREEVCADVPLERRYVLYMGARQQGNWISEIYDDREKYFYAPYSFRLVDSFEGYPPVFITHASGDPDVPFAEAQALNNLLPDTTVYYVSKKQHDYDRTTEDSATVTLLEKTLEFLGQGDGSSVPL